ncbi:MAG TPA: hypothetical protein VFZ64_07440 [Nocardioidaceae bacterium]
MNVFHEELARTHVADRLEEARSRRRAQQFVLARRKSRRAERAAANARLSLLRSL